MQNALSLPFIRPIPAAASAMNNAPSAALASMFSVERTEAMEVPSQEKPGIAGRSPTSTRTIAAKPSQHEIQSSEESSAERPSAGAVMFASSSVPIGYRGGRQAPAAPTSATESRTRIRPAGLTGGGCAARLAMPPAEPRPRCDYPPRASGMRTGFRRKVAPRLSGRVSRSRVSGAMCVPRPVPPRPPALVA